MTTPNWGPRPGGPQISPPPPKKSSNGCLVVFLGFIVLLGFGMLGGGASSAVVGIVFILSAGGSIVYILSAPGREAAERQRHADKLAMDAQNWRARLPENMISASVSPLQTAKELVERSRSTVFLGVTPDYREWRLVESQQAVLVLGPPRSGKTSALIIPTVLTAPGPVVATSTKGDILDATAACRSQLGRIWLFDPSGEEPLPEGALRLNWTPVTTSETWDNARTMADAMVDASEAGKGVENATYWTESAKTLVGPLLHAASLGGRTILDVRRWVTRMDLEEAMTILEESRADAATDDLSAIMQTEEREKSSIFATARLVLNAYGSDAVAKTCLQQNFDSDRFVRSQDVIYIISPSTYQNLMAPLVVGLLEEIRRATYAQARIDAREGRISWPPTLWALDEVANIAPIKKLPSIVSEAGGQGLQVMACFQDLSQARVRWKEAADGFLTLFGTKAVFSGIGDAKTLSALSTLVGDWDRPYTVVNRTTGRTTQVGVPAGFSIGNTTSTGVSYEAKKEAVLSPGDLATIPPGHLLAVQSNKWGLIEALPFYSAPAWQAVLRAAPPRVVNQGPPDELQSLPRARNSQSLGPDHGSVGQVAETPGLRSSERLAQYRLRAKGDADADG